MKSLAILLLAFAAMFAAEKKPLPNQAGNDDLDLTGSVLLEPQEIHQALGADLGPGYVLVRIKVTPKTDDALHISPDDFTLLSRKNGDRCQALAPSQIAGKGALVVKPAAQQPGGEDTRTNGPLWGGVSRLGGFGNKTNGKDGAVEATVDGKSPELPIMAVLEQKILPEKDSKTSVEGLLYFAMDGKLKPKDLSLIYKGRGGRLLMDFK